MLLSIIIPLYNCENEITDCLYSIYNNINNCKFNNEIEVIIVDDGSTDNSNPITKKFIEKNNTSNFYIYKKNNGGVSSARNYGMKYAVGNYIWFVDSDDLIFPKCLDNLLNTIINSNSDILLFDNISGFRDHLDFTIKNNIKYINLSGVEYLAKYNYKPYPWQYIIRKNSIPDNLKFEEGHFFEDTIFTTELLLHANDVLVTNIIAYCYITRDNSITHNVDLTHLNIVIDDYIFVIKYLSNLLDKIKRQYTSKDLLKRIEDRRNSFIFFLLIKIFRYHPERILEIISVLKKEELYPFKYLNKQEYPGLKYIILSFMMNKSYIWIPLCFLKKLIKKLQYEN